MAEQRKGDAGIRTELINEKFHYETPVRAVRANRGTRLDADLSSERADLHNNV